MSQEDSAIDTIHYDKAGFGSMITTLDDAQKHVTTTCNCDET